MWNQGRKTAAETELGLCCYEYAQAAAPVPFSQPDPLQQNTDRWGGDYASFALTFTPKDSEECRELGSDAYYRWQRTGEVPRTLEELRACLWFEQRRWRFVGREPDTEGMRYVGALIRAMRSQL